MAGSMSHESRPQTYKTSGMRFESHGDGSYHTIPNGSYDDTGRVEHPSFGHMVMHMAKHHAEHSSHMHIHETEDGYDTHHVVDGGAVQGPHHHETMGKLKKHISACMDSED